MDLKELLGAQTASQLDRFGNTLPVDWSAREVIGYIRIQVLAAVNELMELIDETGWKPWKSQGYTEINRERYIDELSDVIIFVTNLAVAVDCSPEELEAAIRKTMEKNETRKREGY